MPRDCIIEEAYIDDGNGGGDGAYGLLALSGTPEEIGKAIAEELDTTDCSKGPSRFILGDMDGELVLCLQIKFANHPVDIED